MMKKQNRMNAGKATVSAMLLANWGTISQQLPIKLKTWLNYCNFTFVETVSSLLL